MSSVDLKPVDFHRQSSMTNRKVDIESDPLVEEILVETKTKSFPKLNPAKAEDEVVALILSSIMGSIIKSWQFLDEDKPNYASSKSVGSNDSIQEKCDSLIYEKSVNSELSYCGMSDSRKRHSLHQQLSGTDTIPDGTPIAPKRLGNILKSQFEDLKDRIFGWPFIEEEPNVRIVFKQGNQFEGKLLQCKMQGQGKFTWADGGVYEGEFAAGAMSGEGRLQWPDQSRYEGQLSQGYRHGIGLFIQSPTFFAGHWRCGLRHGHGSMFYDQWQTDRNLYNGEWAGDCKHGTGLRSYDTGARYRGQWCRGRRHGIGTMVWTNCDVYTGNWSNGEIEGYGEYTWDTFFNRQLVAPQENCYYGDWHKGMRNGNGTLETTSGVIIRGTWKDGRKHGPAEVICNNGTFIYANDLFHNDCISTNLDVSTESADSLMDTTTQSFQLYHVPVNSANHQIELQFYIDRLCNHIADCKRNRKAFERDVGVSGANSANNNLRKSIESNRCTTTQAKTITDEDVNYEEIHLRNTICQYLSTLKIIYNKYCNVCCEDKQTFPTVLMRLFLWQFFRDCNLHNKGRSLSDFDILIANNKASLVQGVHYPFERIHFWQFLHCLLEVSWELYGRIGKGTPNIQGVIASALHKLLTSDVFPNVGLHKGDALLKQRDLLSLDAVYWYYRGLGEPLSARKLLKRIFDSTEKENCAKHNISDYPTHLLWGSNIIGVGGRVTYYPEDEPMIPEVRPRSESEQAAPHDLTRLSGIGIVAVFNCLLDICPSIADSGIIVNMDYKLVYLEFLELLLLCAKLNVKKCISEAKKKKSFDKMSKVEEGSSKATPSKELISSSHGKAESSLKKKKTSEEIKLKKRKKSLKKNKS